jgi:hypothetical protein
MSKLADIADIAAGVRAIKRIPLPLVNVPCSLLPDIPELTEQRNKDAEAAASQGAPVVPATIEVGLRVLTGEENLLIERLSNKMAETNGCRAFEETDAIFNMAKSLYTIAVACVDPDSDPKDPDPFFGPRGKTADETAENCAQRILVSPHIGRDGIIFLAEQHEHWQDICNPAALKMSAERMWALVGEVAASADALLKLRPGMRSTFARFMAVLLTSYSQDKWLSGPTSPENSKADAAS